MMNDRFRRFAWAFVGYLILVILFGAWVRIAGAGAGCGNHWPLCNGDVVPQAPATKTIIEFTHRVTSGLCGVFGLVLLRWAWRLRNRRVFWAALATMFFILTESLIGAVLVKKELVANNPSVNHALVSALHLANTLLLTAAAAATAWWAGPERASAGGTIPSRGKGLLVAVLVLLVITNMTGAVTALGDTLFPRQPALDGSLLAKIRDDVGESQHFLVRLRILHPVVAMIAAGFTAGVAVALRRVGVLSTVFALVGVQVLVGFLNVALAAPGWMQIVHLLVAQLLWLGSFVAYLSAAE